MKHANIAVFVPHNGCPNQCSFCNQRTISGASKQPLPADVSFACEKAMQGGCEGADVQLAFFGGSFTAIDRAYMISLLEAAQPYIKSGFLNKGIRVSTRPDFIDGISPGKNIGVGCHTLLQGIFPTQVSNTDSYVSCIGRQGLYH